jgi:hypothetical protein
VLALFMALTALPMPTSASSGASPATPNLVASMAPVVQTSLPQSGTGSAPDQAVPATEAEARRVFAETARKCRQLQVAAVRDECLRQAQRDLDRELQRLSRAGRQR